MEDEHHVIFVCPQYGEVRHLYQDLLRKNDDIKLSLNLSFADCYETAKILQDIESLRNK